MAIDYDVLQTELDRTVSDYKTGKVFEKIIGALRELETRIDKLEVDREERSATEQEQPTIAEQAQLFLSQFFYRRLEKFTYFKWGDEGESARTIKESRRIEAFRILERACRNSADKEGVISSLKRSAGSEYYEEDKYIKYEKEKEYTPVEIAYYSVRGINESLLEDWRRALQSNGELDGADLESLGRKYIDKEDSDDTSGTRQVPTE